jgi:hypothetical protein
MSKGWVGLMLGKGCYTGPAQALVAGLKHSVHARKLADAMLWSAVGALLLLLLLQTNGSVVYTDPAAAAAHLISECA